MYKATYHYKSEAKGEVRSDDEVNPHFSLFSQRGYGNKKTIVEAKFRYRIGKEYFFREDEEEIKRRIRLEDDSGLCGPLGIYLTYAQEIRIHARDDGTFKLNSERDIYFKGTIKIPFFKKGLGFDLKLEDPFREARLEEMINLDELDHFALTGEVPEIIREAPEVRTYLLPCLEAA